MVCECSIVQIVEHDKYKLVQLDRNIFRPAMGGQDCDLGKIVKEDGSEIQILGVLREDGDVFLKVNKDANIRVGEKIKAFVDTERRRLLSMLHTAQHIFYQALNRVTKGGVKFRNVFLTIKDGLPYGELGVLTEEDIKLSKIIDAEILTNNIILENRKDKEYILKKDQIPNDVRVRDSILDKLDTVRIIEVDGFDKSACSGTHVNQTLEIISFKILKWKKKKNSYKFFFTVGKNALGEFSRLSNVLIEASSEFGFNPMDLLSYLKNSYTEIKRAKNFEKNLIDKTIRLIEYRIKIGDYPIIEDLGELDVKYHYKIVKKLSRKHDLNNLLVLVSRVNGDIFLTVFGEKNKIQSIKRNLNKIKFSGGDNIIQLTLRCEKSFKEFLTLLERC